MEQFKNQRIILGVTGSIAAYKAVFLLRLLQEHGAEVQVVMTNNATKFITPLTFQVLSANKTYKDWEDTNNMDHIELARWASLLLVAPASANFIAKYANGIADDLLTTLSLAVEAPVVLAPAMNKQMWANAAVQQNVKYLKEREVCLLGPEIGIQSCGEHGYGRMIEPETLILKLKERLASSNVLKDQRILITAGPTQEPIDPVRHISNRSSGKMGYAIAEAAQTLGARVTLVSGPTAITPSNGIETIYVKTAQDMYDRVMALVENTDIFISTAAVTDYAPTHTAEHKIKSSEERISCLLQRNPDILKAVTNTKQAPFTVGFAAETENLIANAEKKRITKKADMMVANLVGASRGFDSDMNELTVLWQSHQKHLPMASKATLAKALVAMIAARYQALCADKTG